MASKRHQRKRRCKGKARHGSMESAVVEANRLRADNPGEDFDAYGCDECGKFHIGHRTKKVRFAMAARRGE